MVYSRGSNGRLDRGGATILTEADQTATLEGVNISLRLDPLYAGLRFPS